ncbi:MAG: hypothetical protein K0S79_72 [Nitrospira sp.]|jgi:hypothetical protein|nr:hypothetical protein [Nitrospira sp.]
MSETLPTVTRHLPVSLTPERKAALGEDLAEHTFQLQRLEETKKEIAERHTKAIKDVKGTISKLAELMHNGLEMKPVICLQEMDLDHNKLVVRRQDTNEIIEERPLTADEHADPNPAATLGEVFKNVNDMAQELVDAGVADAEYPEVVSGIEASQPPDA